MDEKDLSLYCSCMADPELAETVLGEVPLPERLFNNLLSTLSSDHDLFLRTEDFKENVIGFCFLRNIHPIHEFAELEQFFLLKAFRGFGYGADAIRTLVNYSFALLDLNRIWLITYSYNWAARNLYSKCGFQEEGVLRQIQFSKGVYHDGIMMGLLKSDWAEPRRTHRHMNQRKLEVAV